MTMETSIHSHLIGVAAILALVSDRIVPGEVDQDTIMPYITFERVTEIGTHHQLAASGISAPVYQFDIWAETSASRLEISEALRDSLDGYSGTFGDQDVRVMRIMDFEGTIEEPSDGSEDVIYRCRIDIKIWRSRSVPTLAT